MTDEIAEAIENINRKTPRCGGHIDPWYRAKQHAIEVGCVVEMIVCASVAGLDADKES